MSAPPGATAASVVVVARTGSAWRGSVPASAPAARLFCVPHAGGSYLSFNEWREHLPPEIEVLSFCYAGRLRRIREPPLTDLGSLVNELRGAIAPLLDVPFAFWGHSLGALVAFELARCLYREHGPRPAALIVSAHHAPQLVRRTPALHALPATRLIEELRAMEGLPPGLEQSEELLSLVLPAIRADLLMHETYAYQEQCPLDADILAFAGSSDPQATPEEAEAWRSQTTASFSMRTFAGGHFFHVSSRDDVLAAIRLQLAASFGAALVSGHRC